MENTQPTEECCPKFEPTLWEDKTISFEGKKFIKDKVFTFMYMPINFGGAMTRLTTKADAAGAQTPNALCLSDSTSMWNMDVYLEVTKEVPGANNVTMDGKFISKVYEGDFSKTGDWMKDFDAYVKEKALTIKKTLMWYTNCPKCAQKYGKNYVVIFGQLA